MIRSYPPHVSSTYSSEEVTKAYDPLNSDDRQRDLFISGEKLFSITLWTALTIFTFQAIDGKSMWPLAWSILGAGVLILRQRVNVKYFLLIEAPIFHSIVGYSSSVLYLSSRSGLFDLEHDQFLNDAGWIAFLGMLAFFAGISIPLLRKAPNNYDSAERIEVTEGQAIKLIIFGFICTELLVRFIPASLRVVLVVFGTSTPVGLFTLLILYTRSRIVWLGTPRFYLWLAALIMWALRSVSGGIFGSTLLLLGLFFAQHVRSRLVLFSSIAILIIICPLLQDTKQDYRMKLAEEGSSQLLLKDAFLNNFKKFFINGDLETYVEGIDALASRLCTFSVWTQVKSHMDTIRDYANGSTIFDAIVTSLVPRVVWADKPETGGANDLAVKYADMAIMPGTSVSIGAISEFYLNGGLAYVIPGMFILGFTAAFMLTKTYYDRVQPFGYLMGICMFSVFVRPETSLADTIGPFLRLIFYWLVIRYWFIRKARVAGFVLSPSPVR